MRRYRVFVKLVKAVSAGFHLIIGILCSPAQFTGEPKESNDHWKRSWLREVWPTDLESAGNDLGSAGYGRFGPGERRRERGGAWRALEGSGAGLESAGGELDSMG
jgi:hypothetical protein